MRIRQSINQLIPHQSPIFVLKTMTLADVSEEQAHSAVGRNNRHLRKVLGFRTPLRYLSENRLISACPETHRFNKEQKVTFNFRNEVFQEIGKKPTLLAYFYTFLGKITSSFNRNQRKYHFQNINFVEWSTNARRAKCTDGIRRN